MSVFPVATACTTAVRTIFKRETKMKKKEQTTKLFIMALLGLFVLCGQVLAGWTVPVPVTEINTESAEEFTPFLSFDALTLYFARVHSNTFYYGRIFEATRQEPFGPFTSVKEIDGTLNSSPGHVFSPWVSPDNLRMYYMNELTTRYLLKVSERVSVDDPWPQGSDISELNVLGDKPLTPRLTADELTIFFSSYNMQGGHGGYDLWMATRPDRFSPFGEVRNLAEINTAAHDMSACILPDGLTMIFSSNRNNPTNFQLFMATSPSLDQPFGNIEHLAFFDSPGGGSIHPCLSSDGNVLYFMKNFSQSSRDIWVSFLEGSKIYYVDADADGANDGSSWADAYNYLQNALAVAENGDEIHVAQGIYKPDQGVGITPGDREATFQLINGVAIKGGYAGLGEPDPNARNIEVYETILSGDLSGDDIEVADPRDLLTELTRVENSYHVITGSWTDVTAVVDGFIITGGYANGSNENRYGGGMYNDSGSPTVANCTFSENSAHHSGGMYNFGGSPTLINCTFTGNSSGPLLPPRKFVDAGATGANDGTSWTDAYNYLQDALAVAEDGDEIHVAQGVYKPAGYGTPPLPPPPPYPESVLPPPLPPYPPPPPTPPLDRTATFELKNGVVIKGGYAGFGEPNPNTRDIELYETVLSGDIGIVGDNSDNSFHVVTGNETDETAVLDGFTVTGGNANGSSYINKRGGGMHCDSDTTITNCTFIGNSADWGGGGMYCGPTSCCATKPTITNCTFIGNSAGVEGGGMVVGDSDPKLTNCKISGNSAGSRGGGVMFVNDNFSSMVNCLINGNSADWGGGIYGVFCFKWKMTNCTVSDNSATERGGGMYNQYDCHMTLTNCIFRGNRDSGGEDESAQIDYEPGEAPAVNYSCIQGWTGNLGGTGNIDNDPCFIETEFFNPVSSWKFDEAGGTTAYDSTGFNHGTVYGAQWTTGKVGGALSFDGDGDYVEVDAIAPLAGDTLTAQAWIQFDEFAGLWNPVLTQSKPSMTNDGYYLYVVNGKPSFYVIDGFNYSHAISPETINADQWYHVTVTNDGSTLKLYVDGQLKDITSSTGFTGVNHNAYIGYVSALYYNGLIDDVRIYDRALSADEIQQLYESPVYRLQPNSPCINAGDPDYVPEPNETDLDGKPRIIAGRIDMGAYEFNHNPIADAGPDRTIEAQAPWGVTVTLDGSGSSDADSTPGTIDDINDFNWFRIDPCDPNADVFLGTGRIVDCNLPIGEHIILLEVIDKAGAYDSNEVTIIVQDTTPPDINCPPDVTLECPADTTLSATGKATATDTCGTVTITHSDQWQPNCGNAGTLARTWTATDESGNSSTCVQIITVVDTTPPEFTLSVAPTMLWPPNHKMVLITPSWTVSDDCDATPDVSLVSIIANEGDNTIGDGHTSNDIQIGEDGSIYLRSERSGTSYDRVYTITYQAVDDCGNTTVRSATVSIPHDFRVLARIADRWLWAGQGRIPEDLNGDGIVNLADFARFAENWIR